ncbi:hypothetical protein [Labilibaculum sp.]|uniref:hypothetical protein n=1 Tax=Labilibaculum sp. TaxID=2060723 RepID=UPI00356467BA
MTNWKEVNDTLTELLQLETKIVAIKRMENKDGLKDISGLEKPLELPSMMQLPWLKKCNCVTVV